MKKIQFTGIVLISFISLFVFSCENDKDEANPSEMYKAYVTNVTMKLDGVEYIAKMNENRKQIHFRALPLEILEINPSPLAKVEFDGDFPRGASFEHGEYDFTIPEGETQITKTVSVVNGPRKCEYSVTLRIDALPPGADFSKAVIVTPATQPAASRMIDMDTEHVLVADRTKSFLLSVADLKDGKYEPIYLNLEGVDAGTFLVNGGSIINGHAYLCNLTTSFKGSSPFRLYHWDASAPDEPPTVVASYTGSQTTGNLYQRHGDMLSLDLDSRGGGYAYLNAGNDNDAGGRQFGALRIRISNWTSSSSPTGIGFLNIANTTAGFGGYWQTYNQVDDVTGEYIACNDQGPTRLMDGGGKTLYEIPVSIFPTNADGIAARVINFNGMRYFVAINGLAVQVVVYNITKGETTKEALEILADPDTDKAPVFSFSLGASLGSGAFTANLGYAKAKNEAGEEETLYIIASGADNGFVFAEIPRPAEKDPDDTSDPFFDDLDNIEGYE